MDIGNITEGILTDIANKDQTAQEDYEKDGYLYCGKCGEVKGRVRRNSQGDKMVFDRGFFCACMRNPSPSEPKEKEPFDLEKWEKEQRLRDERREEERKARIERIRDRAFPDVRLKRWTFDTDDNANKHITSVAKKFVDNFYEMQSRGKGLLLYGGVGTGKTYIAACITNALVDKELSCRFTNFSRLANELMANEFNERQNFIDGLNRFDLLVIDDFGIERSTEFMNEVVFSVIDARHKSGKPLIATTNLTGENLKHPTTVEAERIYSRLFEMCIPVEVKGQDRRKLKLRDEDADLKEMLGLINGQDK